MNSNTLNGPGRVASQQPPIKINPPSAVQTTGTCGTGYVPHQQNHPGYPVYHQISEPSTTKPALALPSGILKTSASMKIPSQGYVASRGSNDTALYPQQRVHPHKNTCFSIKNTYHEEEEFSIHNDALDNILSSV